MPHPLDVNYELLKAKLQHLDKSQEQYAVIEKYLRATEPHWRKLKILDMWEVNREEEVGVSVTGRLHCGVQMLFGALFVSLQGKRFSEHSGTGNRKLLWHGTNVAVVAAILKSGLRIMPHSGGRVGRGIYFASENSKSAGYGE